MEEQEKIMVLDEFGNEREAKILNVVEINNQEYLVYSVSQNEEEDGIYAQKLIKDASGNEDIIPIENEDEKRLVFETIREFIDELD